MMSSSCRLMDVMPSSVAEIRISANCMCI
jgi:hypothetical protein